MRAVLVAIAAFIAMCSAAKASNADISGRWQVRLPALQDGTQDEVEQTFIFRLNGSVLTGTRNGPMGTVNLTEGSVQGNKISFSLINPKGGKVDYRGTIHADYIQLNLDNHRSGLQVIRLHRK